MTTSYKVLALDFDGVIANSMPVIERCWRDAIAAVVGPAAPVDAVIVNLYGGIASLRMFDGTGIDQAHVEPIRAAWREIWPTVRATVPLLDGVAEALPGFAARYTLAVASNARRDYLELVLGRAGVAGHFAHILGADDIAHIKPHPEILQSIAARAGVTPSEICMVGDTAADYGAATAAGTGFVLMQADVVERIGLDGHAGPTVTNWRELTDLLAA